MKGIILLGGSGTRLHPATKAISKQLIPIYDKPMCYYSLSTLLLAGIRDILVISTPEHLDLYKKLLLDGSQWGVNFTYKVQDNPEGLPQAFTLGESFIGDDSVCLVLGDNIFYGHGLTGQLERAAQLKDGAKIFTHYVNDPERFGIAEIDENDKVLSLEEKPPVPKSNYAIVGLYFFDNSVIEVSKNLKKSPRGEYEIVDVMKHYLAQGNLYVQKMGRGQAWLDTGTYDSLLEASNFVQTIQKTQGLGVACLEEIVFKQGWIGDAQLKLLASQMKDSFYKNYILKLLND